MAGCPRRAGAWSPGSRPARRSRAFSPTRSCPARSSTTRSPVTPLASPTPARPFGWWTGSALGCSRWRLLARLPPCWCASVAGHSRSGSSSSGWPTRWRWCCLPSGWAGLGWAGLGWAGLGAGDDAAGRGLAAWVLYLHPGRHRDRHPQARPVRYRPAHHPDPGLHGPDRGAGRDLCRRGRRRPPAPAGPRRSRGVGCGDRPGGGAVRAAAVVAAAAGGPAAVWRPARPARGAGPAGPASGGHPGARGGAALAGGDGRREPAAALCRRPGRHRPGRSGFHRRTRPADRRAALPAAGPSGRARWRAGARPADARRGVSVADRRVLAELAAQAGVAVYAIRLTADLQQARARLVAAREEERRRLRRDLHDGLGPTLAGVVLGLETAGNLLDGQPPAAQTRALLERLRDETHGAIAGIRRLVYGLRPPALDDLGLVPALQTQAATLGQGTDGMMVSVEADGDLTALPAAVEVAARRIVAASPHTAVLVLTMFSDDVSLFAAMRAGARGYLLKGAGQVEIVQSIQAVARGEAVFGPAVANRVLAYFSGPPPAPAEVFPELTDREREVLELLARGELNAAIARRLGLSPKTVRNHVSNIFAKLQVADRAQAVIRAR